MKVFQASTTGSPNDVAVEDRRAVADRIMSGDIAIFRDVVPAATGATVRQAVIAWAKANTPWQGDTRGGQTPAGNWFRRDINPPQSATPRILQTHDFGDLHGLEEPFRSALLSVFEPMVRLQSDLSGQVLSLKTQGDGPRLHPQIIHYPRGGGYFGRHVHPLEPQRIGLIVALSAHGTDFSSGSTLYYRPDGSAVDLDSHQSAGSVTAFRYDIPHSVTAVDCEAEIAFDDPGGRWVAIMPYH